MPKSSKPAPPSAAQPCPGQPCLDAHASGEKPCGRPHCVVKKLPTYQDYMPDSWL